MSLNYLDEQKCVPRKGLSKITFQNLSTSFGPEKKTYIHPRQQLIQIQTINILFV